MTWPWDLLSPYDSSSKFWCKHMPPNFGIKVILFQIIMSISLIGPQSRVKNLDLGSTICRRLCQLMSPCFKTFTRASLLHGPLDSSFQAGYKMSIRPWREQLNNSAMFLFHLPPRVLLTLSDPPWSILLLWRSWVVRRILVHRVIVSLILAPHWARRPAITVRRILVISPESSLHAHKAILVCCEG